MHGVHVHLGEQRSQSSNYWRNKDVAGLVKLTYVTGPDEPCDVSGEVRPPKAVSDVCSCGEVSVMSGGIVSCSKNCWSFVAVDHYFMATLWIPSPKMAIYLEEVFGIPQESSICSIGKSWRLFGGLEPFTNTSHMVVSMAGSLGSGEKVIGEQWFVSDGVRDVCQERSQTWNLRLEWVQKVHKPIDLVNPIVKLRLFCRFSIFISRLLRLAGEAIRAVSSTGDVNEGEVEQQDGDDSMVHAGGWGEVGIC